MELRQLRYFVAVVEAGSFSSAAQRLFVAQPALSVQVRALEELVGKPLLLRHRRGVSPTPAGLALLHDARQLLTQVQAALSNARSEGAQPHRLRFGLVPSATETLLPGLVRALRASHADLRIEARELPTAAQIEGLKDGRIDFCLGRPPSSERSVQTLCVHEDPYCLALPERHTIAGRRRVGLADVAQDDFVSFGRDRGANYFDRTIAMCVEAGFSPNIRHEANTFSSALCMVAAALGVSIIPASCALLEQRGVAVRRLPTSRHHSRLALLADGNRRHPLHDEVQALVAKQMAATFKAVERALR
jgi:DNA-binding transcriptional LysR family regulator